MEKLTEFPALEDRKVYLEHALYEATRQNDDTAFDGKHNLGGEQWLARIRAELKELRYALWVLGSQGNNKIDATSRKLALVIIVAALVTLAQIAMLTLAGH